MDIANTGPGALAAGEYMAPSMQEAFSGTAPQYLIALGVCSFLCAMVVLAYIIQIVGVAQSACKTRTAHRLGFLLALLPITSCAALVAMYIPRTVPMAKMVIHIYYARCLFLFVEIVGVDLYGDRARMKRKLHAQGLQAKFDVPPIACCMPFLPKSDLSGRLLHRLEWLIWQNGVVRALLTFAIGIAIGCIDLNRIGKPIDTVISPVVPLAVAGLASTVTAMFALNVYANVVAVPLSAYRAKLQFRFMQLFVLIYNLQGNIFTLLGQFRLIPSCGMLTAPLNAQFWQNALLILEMFVMAGLIIALFRRKHNLLLRHTRATSAAVRGVSGGDSDVVAVDRHRAATNSCPTFNQEDAISSSNASTRGTGSTCSEMLYSTASDSSSTRANNLTPAVASSGSYHSLMEENHQQRAFDSEANLAGPSNQVVHEDRTPTFMV